MINNIRKNVVFKVIAAVVLLLAAIAAISVVMNFKDCRYEDLETTEQKILSELDMYFKAEKETPVWPGFELSEKNILAVEGRMGKAYLVGSELSVNSPFAKEIKMPEEYEIKVYRICSSAPQLFKFKGFGNFNNDGKTYKLFGNEVYFTRYDNESDFDAPFDSSHYITFLSHESFHYYMQGKWSRAGRYSTEDITDADLDLLEEEYNVFNDIQSEMLKEETDREKLLEYSRKYIDIVGKRLEANEAYVKQELDAETEEGTATYVGIGASKAVGYPFDVMCLSSGGQTVENLPFDVFIPTIKSGEMSISSLPSDWVYQTGALICKLMDEIGVPGWKETLNSQTDGNTTNLYMILKEYMETLE